MSRRSDCPACERESPYENHGWVCTRGEGCVERKGAPAIPDPSAFRRGAEAMRDSAKDKLQFMYECLPDGTAKYQLSSAVAAIAALPLPEAPPSRDDATAASEALRVARGLIKEALDYHRTFYGDQDKHRKNWLMCDDKIEAALAALDALAGGA